MGYEESKIEGRNAVLEAFRSGKTIDKLFVLDVGKSLFSFLGKIFDIKGGMRAQVNIDFGTAIKNPKPRLNNWVANAYFLGVESFAKVCGFRYFDLFLSISFMALETGKDAPSISP